MRVLLDANVLVSARINPKGEAHKILNQAGAQYQLLLSDFLLYKTEHTFGYAHIRNRYPHISDDAVADCLATLRDLGELVSEQTVIAPSDETSKDEEDLRILAAATDGRAKYLVTYNVKHFPETYATTSILLPRNFSQILLP